MLRNYFLIAVRNILRDKVFSTINIVGLAVGIACFLSLYLFIQDEVTFDRFKWEFEPGQIYRAYVEISINGVEDTNSKTAWQLGPVLSQGYPEVETYARVGYYGPRAFRHNDKLFRSGSIYAVDSTFFKIFPLTFIEGNPATALVDPNSVVLTESASKRIFGDENPVGKILPTESGQSFQVTALVRDFPRKSHFRCDYLESLSTYDANESWMDLWFTTYVVLRPGADAREFEKKLQTVVREHVGPEAESLLGVPIEQFLHDGNTYAFHIQPFTSIYLHSRELGIDPNTEWGNVTTSDIVYAYMFSVVAVFILVLAVINFMNLSTAKSERRAREVGIRKTFGSERSRLIFQFIGEAVLTSFIAMLLALALLTAVLPLFNILLERDLSLVLINKFYTVPLIIGFVVLVGVLAGSYPAFYLSSFKPSKVLKGGEGSGRRKSVLRNSLVIVQFAISICLLIGTLVIKKQLDYIQNKNLGFNKDHLLSISNANLLGDHVDAFKEELLKSPNVLSATNASRMFSTGVPGSGYLFNKKTGTDPMLCQFVVVDYDFLKTFQIQLDKGRNFSKEFPSDKNAVLINEAAAALLPTDDPLGKELVSLDARDKGHGYEIIGIIHDFNYESLHSAVRPLVVHLQEPRDRANILSMRIASNEMKGTLQFIEDKWKEFAPVEPLHYNFVDASLERLYVAEQKTNLASIIFSAIAIFIACIGLFGLSAFVTEQRTKEIGIRKVLGATATQVVMLLSREFALWVLISNIIAWPVAWYVMKDWLGNFAFRTELSFTYFLLAGVSTFLIALLTVGFHALKAAEANPVTSLKHE